MTDDAATDLTQRPCSPIIRELMARIGDRWTLPVLGELTGQVLRFGDIQRRLPDISQRMLSVTLRRLERDGLVSRHVFGSIPPRVEYRLTALGESFLEPVETLFNWARTHQDAVGRNNDAAAH